MYSRKRVNGASSLIAFLRVFDGGAESFTTDEDDPQKLRSQIGAWLGVIALNIFRARLRADKRIKTLQIDEFELTTEEPTPLSEWRLKQCEQLKNILDNLKPRERDILLARFANYHRNGGKHQFEPHVLEQLAADWQITKDNVRQIYSRTMRKITEQLTKP